MTKDDRDQFRMYCLNATDKQLEDIVEKERQAAARAPAQMDRAICLAIAESEREFRLRPGKVTRPERYPRFR